MRDRFDPDTFGFVVTDLSRLIRADMDRRILGAGLGVTPGEARTLLHAARLGEVRQNVLAERMGVEAMTLSTYLERLEEKGLVSRIPDKVDRRAKLVRVTVEAEGVLEGISRIGRDMRARARGGMSDDEWANLQRLLKITRANFSDNRRSSVETE